MYTTEINKQLEIVRQREEEKVQIDDVYNLEQQIERQLDREGAEKVGTDRCIQLRSINRQRQLDRVEEEKERTDRCMKLRTIDREIVRQRGG